MAKFDWHPVLEMDLEDGTHTCYAATVGNWFIWLTQLSDDTWDVELGRKGAVGFTTQMNCKTLTSAKRWAARYLYL